MPRLMSVALTEQAVRERRKTVTRRLGWKFLKPGDRLTLCRKVQGRRHRDGTVEPLVRLADVEVVNVRREPLVAITAEDIEREGVHSGRDDEFIFDELQEVRPGWWAPEPYEWARWFADTMDLPVQTQAEFDCFMVTRIEWRYLDDS